MPSTSPKDGLLKTKGIALIVEVLNDRKAIAGNVLLFDLIVILQLIY
jgi:hypothetical protein